jgi:Fic family protein
MPGLAGGFSSFQPEPLPRALTLDPATVQALSEADAAVGRLEGLGLLIKDPTVLLGPYLTREAVASSRIEGTQASLTDVLQAEADAAPRNEDVREVERYIAAVRRGVDRLPELPISQRLICELHAVLMSGVRGGDRTPGELRRGPVWIGSPTDSPETAIFVPPLPERIPGLLSDWERFVNEPPALPTLVRCALMHYQFETIHPFSDGNGRIGRLLVGLLLMQSGRLSAPLLYVSGYLEDRRQEYYSRLQAVRERGEVQEWLQFFLTAVRRQADDAAARAEHFVALRERLLDEASNTRGSLPALVGMMFANPFVTISRVSNTLGMTQQGARLVIKQAEQRGWLTQVGTIGKGGRLYWIAREILDAIDAPLSDDRTRSDRRG